MTDRELLELAAKAAGIEHGGWSSTYQALLINANEHGVYEVWNPLGRDELALQLAVKLGLCIDAYPIYAQPKHAVIVKQRRRGDQMRESNPTEVVESYGDDPAAATRRAIVMAAAALGAQQEQQR